MADLDVCVDHSAGASYIQLSAEPVVRTVEVGDSVQVDLDAQGRAVGVELLYVYDVTS